jgi:hypothetical protein
MKTRRLFCIGTEREGKMEIVTTRYREQHTTLILNFQDWCCRLAKHNFGPTDRHHPHSRSLPRVRTAKGVQNRLRFCLDRLNYVKMSGKQKGDSGGQIRRVGRVGNDSHVVFGKTLSCERR